MRAIVLVGGFGTRLRPLTLDRPKQMLPVLGRTMLERVAEKLAACGVRDAVLSLGYQPDTFLSAFPDGECAGVRLTYAVEPEPLDTAGAIRFAADFAGLDETFLAVNGDVLTDLDLSALWNAHHEFGGEATIALTPVDDPSRYGVVPLDAQNRVEAFIEKPPPGEAPSNWINAGSYVLEPTVLELTAKFGERVSIEREVFPALVDQGALYGVQSDAYWIDAGTPQSYLQANLDLIDGVRGHPEEGRQASAVAAADAVVHRSAIGSGVRIGAGASVTESVVMDGVRVEAGAHVHRALIGPRSVIGEGAHVGELCVVGSDSDIPDGANLLGECWPAEAGGAP